jgi:Fe-S oxidoreductase
VKLEGVTGTRYMYHDPCHSPMKLQDPLKTVNSLITTVDAQKIEKNQFINECNPNDLMIFILIL